MNCPPLPAAEPSRIDFARDIQPIFKSHCYSCHDGRKHKADLRLDVRASARRGGESGQPPIVSGDSSHWLDAAPYPDSDGFEKDKSQQVWFYRDWVINALNRDLPYDRFIVG